MLLTNKPIVYLPSSFQSHLKFDVNVTESDETRLKLYVRGLHDLVGITLILLHTFELKLSSLRL